MCGRVNVADNEGVRALLESMGMDTWPSRDPRFNIAPTQTLDVVQMQEQPVLQPMSWGVSMVLPGKKGMVTKRVQNARDDKVWSSRLWRPLMQAQRVLVPVNGFYEWKRENRKLVAAYYITPSHQKAMFFAGIYKQPNDAEARPEVSIITTAANEQMSHIHHRMPVILATANEANAWLQESDQPSLSGLMQAAGKDMLTFTEVDSYVNKSSNEGPQCIAAKVA